MKKQFVLLFALLLLTGCSSYHQHSYQKANYQTPETCTICGKTKGFELEPDFEIRNIETNMEYDLEYPYSTICLKDETLPTTGKVSIIKDEILQSDSTHPAKEGYHYHIVTMKLVFNDFNSNEYGFKYNYFTTDYYNITDFTNSYQYDSSNQINTFTVNYNGKDFPCTLNTIITKTDWKKNSEGLYTKTITITQEFLLPEGYDGIVVGFRDSSIDVYDSVYLFQYYQPEKFLLYRLENHND